MYQEKGIAKVTIKQFLVNHVTNDGSTVVVSARYVVQKPRWCEHFRSFTLRRKSGKWSCVRVEIEIEGSSYEADGRSLAFLHCKH